MAIAIILAAGDGKRLSKNLPKALVQYKNKPIIEYSLKEFSTNKKIKFILVVYKKEYRENYEKILKKYKNCFLIAGGNSRQNSLTAAMNFIKDNLKYSNERFIITHDCARVNINQKLINKHLKFASYKSIAVSTILKCSDSVIEKNKNHIAFCNRENLYLVQTPQSFTIDLWRKKQTAGTDLFSCLNIPIKKIKFVNGSNDNFKITYSDDLINS